MRIRLAALLALVLCLPLLVPPARSAPAPVYIALVHKVRVVTSSLRITDLVYSGSDEYVAIQNTGSQALSLGGYRLHSLVGDQWYTFAEYTLGPDEIVRVHSGAAAIASPPQDLLWTKSYIWNDLGDSALLYDPQGLLMASYGY